MQECFLAKNESRFLKFPKESPKKTHLKHAEKGNARKFDINSNYAK